MKENKYSYLSQEQMLEVCNLINPNTKWEFHQYLDNDGKGGDDCYEFLGKDESCIQFNIHQAEDDEIRCYLKGDWDNDEVPPEKFVLIDNYLDSQLSGPSTLLEKKADKDYGEKVEEWDEDHALDLVMNDMVKDLTEEDFKPNNTNPAKDAGCLFVFIFLIGIILFLN